MSSAPAPYNLEVADNCLNCRFRSEGHFCNFATPVLQALSAVSYISIYPEGAVLFVEGQEPHGVYFLCRGRAKLSMVSAEGKSLILRITEAGELLDPSASLLGQPHTVTVETLAPSQVNFVRREDFLRFLRSWPEAMFRMVQHVSREYQSACREINSLGLTHSATAKMAKLLLGWQDARLNAGGLSTIKLTLTHEEMAQMIGATRETVTRILARFRNRDYIEIHGATLFIRNRSALQSIADNRSDLRPLRFATGRDSVCMSGASRTSVETMENGTRALRG